MADRGQLRILVSLRSDGSTKPGGDVSLLRTFADQLAGRHRVETVTGVPTVAELRANDLVMTANLDRPIEPAATLSRAERAGTPMVHYALHHPAAGVTAYLQDGVHGVRRQLGRLAGSSPIRYEQLLWTLHAGSDLIRHRRRPAYGSVARAQQRLLAGSRVVVSSEAEAAAIADDIGPIGGQPGSTVSGDYDVVAHPVDFPDGVRRVVRGRVIVPGRIESRKNQLGALALARRFTDLEFLVVGGLNPSDRRYGKRFLAELAATPNATHVEHLPKDEFYPLLLSAEVVLCPSWFEVTSLIELYCAANEIPLLASQHSYLPAGEAIARFDPRDLDRAEAALVSMVARSRADSERSAPSVLPVAEAEASVGLTTLARTSIVEVVDGLAFGRGA